MFSKLHMLIALTVLSLINIQYAFSDTRCNCSPSKRIGDCASTINMSNNLIKITSNSQQCSMVSWYADGEPKVSIVTDGEEREEWLGSKKPTLEIGGCEVCADNQYTGHSGAANNESISGTWCTPVFWGITQLTNRNVKAKYWSPFEGGKTSAKNYTNYTCNTDASKCTATLHLFGETIPVEFYREGEELIIKDPSQIERAKSCNWEEHIQYVKDLASQSK